MARNKRLRDKVFRIARYTALAVILFLVILHFFRLDIDPPFFFAGFSQADLTDPYHMTFYARNAALFGNWDPFDYHRWDVFRNSLMSGTAYLVFLIMGISRITANFAAILLNLGGLTLFALGFFRLRNNREIVFTILMLLLNAILFFHSRLPFLENGLIFLSGLIFFVFMRFHGKAWGQLLVGFLVMTAALNGKLFGLFLLGPIVLTLWYRYRSLVVKPVLITLAGSLIGFIFCLLLFYGGNITVMAKYYAEQTIGLHGIPIGFTSPVHFVENLIIFGGNFGFFELAIFPGLLAFAGLILLMLTLPFEKPYRKEFLPVLFSLGWLVVGVFGLMPFTYQALRYAVFLFLPISAITGYGINLLFEKKIELNLHYRWLTLGVVFLSTWFILTQIFLLTVPYLKEVDSARRAMPLTMVLSLLFTGAVYFYLKNRVRSLPVLTLAVFVSLLSVGLFVEQGAYFYQGLALPQDNLKKCNREISQLIDSNAVLTGTYAPAMTIDNNLKGVIYFFGSVDVEKELFEKYPITHVITDESNWKKAVKDYPVLEKAIAIRRFAVRDFTVTLYRMPDANVALTDYEKATLFYYNKQSDSALFYQEKFHNRYPDNLSSLTSLVIAYGANREEEKFNRLLSQMVQDYPDNLQMQLFLRDMYNSIYSKSGDVQCKAAADNFDRRAKELDPALVPRIR